ncbi:MAG: hypothetical protein HC906_06365 [Bacteroidales bacterium]|nr:hypothetical protein [Bacteroidales bacterium]
MKYITIFCLILQVIHTKAQRDPLKWPFSQTSIWNMPIHKDAGYQPVFISQHSYFGSR